MNKIYKKDTKGKIRFLEVIVEKDEVKLITGLLNGKTILHSSKSTAKNIGRSNETSSEEQALKDANAIIIKKLKEGYYKTIKETESNELILPMLAKSYNKELKKIDWSSAYVQPKLDGMRCLLSENGKRSRKNREIDTMEHIQISVKNSNIVDGELYAHGYSFQDNMKMIKKYRKGLSELVDYYVYDLISDKPFIERYNELKVIVGNSDNVKIVPTYKVSSEEDVVKFHKQFLEEGYEGTMVRWGNEPYKINGRSSNLLKYKDFIDISAKVIDVIPSDKNTEQGVVVCEFNSKTFGCGMKFSHSEREEILLNKKEYIGQIAEIRFFEFTEDNIPRFPVCVGFRLDK